MSGDPGYSCRPLLFAETERREEALKQRRKYRIPRIAFSSKEADGASFNGLLILMVDALCHVYGSPRCGYANTVITSIAGKLIH